MEMIPRRPWEITPEERVAVGESLSTIPSEVWGAMDYYLGFMAATAYTDGRGDIAEAYLGVVGNLRATVAGLAKAREEATRELDPKRMYRGAGEVTGDEDVAGDEPTPAELRDAATRAARSHRGAV